MNHRHYRRMLEDSIEESKDIKSIYETFAKAEIIHINISLPDEGSELDKSEYYTPTKEGEIHPTKGHVAKRHPEGELMWHVNDEKAKKHDSIINDPKMRQRFLSKLPTETHRQGLEAIINKVAKDPNRHFIPSRDSGREKMRARHIKNLLLYPEKAKIDLGADNVLRISMARHGYSGGYTEWPFQLSTKKVAKNEENRLERDEQRRDFEVDERIFSRRDSGEYGRDSGVIKKTQYRADLSGGGDGNIRNRVSGKHLQKLQFLAKGAMKKLAPFKPTYGSEEHEAVEEWTGFGDADSSTRDQIPAMSENAKVRALHKLGRHTEVRRHPKTGERMFLLHRGMSGDEYNESHSYSDHRMNHSVYDKDTKTSWTPHIDVALGFAKDHKELSTDRKGKVVSAWIPESEIHHIPNQTVVPDENNQFRNEHEVIVNHTVPHPHANKELVNKARFPHKQLDTKINMKGKAEQARKDKTPPDKMLNDIVSREKKAKEYRLKASFKKGEEDMKTLSKADLSSKIKAGLATMAVAGSLHAQQIKPVDTKNTSTTAPAQQKLIQQEPISAIPANPEKRKKRILSSIMDVESSGGQNTNHAALPVDSIHRGEKAYGKYGLTPLLIRETIKAHKDLSTKHEKAMKMKGSDLHNYMDKNPDLEHTIASRHYDRVSKVFGHDPSKIAMAWINGIQGTKDAIKKGTKLDEHWHVAKVLSAFNKRKMSGK